MNGSDCFECGAPLEDDLRVICPDCAEDEQRYYEEEGVRDADH